MHIDLSSNVPYRTVPYRVRGNGIKQTVLAPPNYYPLPGLIVPLSAGKRGTIIQGGGMYSNLHRP